MEVKTNKTNSVTNKKQKGVSNAMKSWRQLKKHKMAVIAGIILLIIYFFVIFAGLIAPYSPYETYKEHFYHPPTKVHFTDEDGLSWPYVYATEKAGWAKYEEITDQKYPIKLFHRGPEYKFWGLFKTNIHLVGVDEPAHLFLMGTDNFGRDIFSRILFGGRISMFIGILGILITTIFGVTIGSISGYYGGFIDSILMRMSEIILSIPQFYLLLALAAVLPISMTSTMRFLLIIVILSFISWAGMSRVIRGMVLSIKNEDYVKAAKALGATDLRIIFKHVIPSTATYVIINATLAVPGYILMESGLSFLGLGIQEPDPSWGNMLTSAQKVTKITNYPWVLIPGLMIFIAVLFYNILGDGVRDALDPKSNKN
ncbi:MAG: ABC transporter permease [Halanaerobiales bacterium]